MAMRRRIGWVVLGALLLGAGARAQVRITEVMANPTAAQGGQKGGEFVELFNLGEEPVDLAGWKIADRDAEDLLLPFFEGDPTVLAPQAFAVVLDPDFLRRVSLFRRGRCCCAQRTRRSATAFR
ncbi:MAG: hypothetical protein KatS3mg115_2165 [Candidatus Poribacteria bacterium]|nr:MAG: hypothetical protein KatS3mg115_2165 [Candidatus Poribacteria bacterium]